MFQHLLSVAFSEFFTSLTLLSIISTVSLFWFLVSSWVLAFFLWVHTLWNFICGNFLMPDLKLCFFGEDFNSLLTGTLGYHKLVPCLALETERLKDFKMQHLPSGWELASVLIDLYEFTFLLQFWTSRIFFVLLPTQWCVEYILTFIVKSKANTEHCTKIHSLM